MNLPRRPIAFVIAATHHGTLIVNRNDYHMTTPREGFGVGLELLTKSGFQEDEVDLLKGLLRQRRRHFGDGVVAIDGGANIGVHTVEWARMMHGWGTVLSFEAQELVFYALAGNVAVNNCLNARVRWAALGSSCGELAIPQLDPHVPASFGSLELRQRPGTEAIGQPISYDTGMAAVPMVSIDSLALPRVDFVKLDVEGMEVEVLSGARETIAKHKPMLVVEVIKSDRAVLEATLASWGYSSQLLGQNLVCLHRSDPTQLAVSVKDGVAQVSLS